MIYLHVYFFSFSCYFEFIYYYLYRRCYDFEFDE